MEDAEDGSIDCSPSRYVTLCSGSIERQIQAAIEASQWVERIYYGASLTTLAFGLLPGGVTPHSLHCMGASTSPR